VGLNGQNSLRVQKNGLKITNKIWELELSAGRSVKPRKAKFKVQTFDHEHQRRVNFDGQYVKPSKAKPKLMPKEEGASHSIPCPKQPLQSNGQDLVTFIIIIVIIISGLSTIVWVSIHP
jgi:hypothetical protein